MGGAAEAKGEQANDLQRAAGEATGREGKQAPDKYQQIGDTSGGLNPQYLILSSIEARYGLWEAVEAVSTRRIQCL